jgi:hypothetical protein
MIRSVGAVLAGILVNVILSIATDAALNAAGVFPPLSEPEMFTTPLLLLATAYRTVYGVAGAYLTSRLAPNHPMGHALALGLIGLLACGAGAVAMWGHGPAWYPIALVVLAMPCAWVGGRLRVTQLEGMPQTPEETPAFDNPCNLPARAKNMNSSARGCYAAVNGLNIFTGSCPGMATAWRIPPATPRNGLPSSPHCTVPHEEVRIEPALFDGRSTRVGGNGT